MRRLFGVYGIFIAVAITTLIIISYALSGEDNGFMGADGIGGIRPSQSTKSENNSETIKTLYGQKEPVLVITPVTLSVGNTYNFYSDFTTTASAYMSDGSLSDIKEQLVIKEMIYLSRTDMSDPDITRTSIDLSSVDLSAYCILKKGIYEVTYSLTDHLGFETTGTYQFPAD